MARADGDNPGNQRPADKDEAARSLVELRASYPDFRIWREITGNRIRYVARRLRPGCGPHTLVSDDLTELREALGTGVRSAPGSAGSVFGTQTPNIARMYNYWLGGKDHYSADREAADSILADFPEVAQVARANRDFVTRAVQYVATQGITQFIDIGAGLPASPAVHETAKQVSPAARVAYIDNDPLVLAHARALLAGGPGVAVVPGDMREPAVILGNPDLRRLIDIDQPVCILLASVLHFLPPTDADATVAAFTSTMTPGSYLILSAGTSTNTSPALIDRLRSAYAATSDIAGRTVPEIAAWFTGLDLVTPGLVDVQAWRPGCQWHWLTPPTARIIGAVGRKPAWHRTPYGRM